MRLRSSGSSIPAGISSAHRHALRGRGGRQGIASGRRHFAEAAHLRRAVRSARDVHQVLQQLLNAPRSPVNVSCQPLHVGRRQIGVHQHFGPAVNSRQRIAEVVHDGTGEPADGGDPLLPDQLLARLPDGGAHLVESARQPAHLVLAAHLHLDGIVVPRHLRRRAVELFHRLDDAPRHPGGRPESHRDSRQPGEHNFSSEPGHPLLGALERAQNRDLSHRLARDVRERLGEAGVIHHAVAHLERLRGSPQAADDSRRGTRIECRRNDPAGSQEKKFAGSTLFELFRGYGIDAVTRHQNVQQRLALGGIDVDRRHRNLVQLVIPAEEAGRLLRKSRRRPRHQVQITLRRKRRFAAERGHDSAPRVRHQKDRVRGRDLRPHFAGRILNGGAVSRAEGQPDLRQRGHDPADARQQFRACLKQRGISLEAALHLLLQAVRHGVADVVEHDFAGDHEQPVSATEVESRIFASSGRLENRNLIFALPGKYRRQAPADKSGRTCSGGEPGMIAGLGNRNQGQASRLGRNADGAFQKPQDFGQGSLVKNVQAVLARRQIGDRELARRPP